MMIRFLPMFIKICNRIHDRCFYFPISTQIGLPIYPEDIPAKLLCCSNKARNQLVIVFVVYSEILLHLFQSNNHRNALLLQKSDYSVPPPEGVLAFSFRICTASGRISLPSTRSLATYPIIPFPANSSRSSEKERVPRSPML